MESHASPADTMDSSCSGPSPAKQSYHEMQPIAQQHRIPPAPLSIQTTGYSNPQQTMDYQGPPIPPGTNYSNPAQFRVNMWQRNYDSGVQSMQHSQNPSILSMPASSRMSAMSLPEQPELTEQQQQKFDKISSVLNTEHGNQINFARAVPELLNLLRDQDQVVVLKAAIMLLQLAKLEDSAPCHRPEMAADNVILTLVDVLRDIRENDRLIDVVLHSLHYILKRPFGFDLVLQINESREGEVVKTLIQHIPNENFSIHKYVILNLHTILSDKRSQKYVGMAIEMQALQKCMKWLELERSDKLLSVIVALCEILCKHEEQKRGFLDSNGAVLLCHILSNFNYENLLLRATSLLCSLANVKNPLKLVECGAMVVLARRLSHPSERLVLNSLKCLRSLSDVGKNNANEVLMCLLQLLGSQNMIINLYTAQILMNMTGNHAPNKEFLVRNRAVPTLIRVLHTVFMQGMHDHSGKIEELQETIMTTLCSLCSGHPLASEVQLKAFEAPGVFLDLLLRMRPKVLRKTIQFLLRVAQLESNIRIFREAQIPGYPVTIGEQLVLVIRAACQNANHKTLESVKLKDLCLNSLQLLQILCKDAVILEKVTFSLLDSPEHPQVFLPMHLIQHNIMEEEQVKKAALELVSILTAHPRIAHLFQSSPEFINILNQADRSGNPDYVNPARKALHQISLGGALPSSHYGVPGPFRENGADNLPEDLRDITLHDDPMANIFCQNDTYSPEMLTHPIKPNPGESVPMHSSPVSTSTRNQMYPAHQIQPGPSYGDPYYSNQQGTYPNPAPYHHMSPTGDPQWNNPAYYNQNPYQPYPANQYPAAGPSHAPYQGGGPSQGYPGGPPTGAYPGNPYPGPGYPNVYHQTRDPYNRQ